MFEWMRIWDTKVVRVEFEKSPFWRKNGSGVQRKGVPGRVDCAKFEKILRNQLFASLKILDAAFFDALDRRKSFVR